MKRDSRIYVAGHSGLAGSAIVRRLRSAGYGNLLLRPHGELDLRQQHAVQGFFQKERPEYVFMAAAKVGGILANATFGADFIYDNLAIALNVLHAARHAEVRKLLYLGSSCIYPKLAPQPMKEEYLLTAPLEPTNEPYAIAKIAGIKLCAAFNRQYGTRFLCVMPTNLFGPRDSYDLQNSHVLPALLRKMHEAKVSRAREVVIWGTGSARREFLYSDDFADACVFVMERLESADVGEFINVGTGEDHSIRELAQMLAEVVSYDGGFIFDTSKPEGPPRKLLDVSRLRSLGWSAKTPLQEGLRKTYAAFLSEQAAHQ